MLFYRALLISLLLISITSQAEEPSWQGALRDGSQIAIDPLTNKVTRSWQGEAGQLWDGVHQLDNGAVIIVRDGIVVKDMAVLNIQREQQRQQLEEACILLVRKVCGPRNECDSHPACDPAKQLQTMERKELRGWAYLVPESTRQCMQAMSNEGFFQACSKRSAGTPLSACEELQRRVCGAGNQSAESEACDAAGQLLKMEREDSYASPAGSSQSSAQCSGVLDDQGFFHACK